MNKPYKITIGIPAYNEEKNIKYLLQDIYKQDMSKFVIEKIIVSSDGSTDGTVSIAKKWKKLPMQVFANKERKGVAIRQNQITKNALSEVLVILNGDIRISDPLFLQKIIKPIIKNRADLVSAQIEETKSDNFFEEMLRVSMIIKHTAFNTYKNGDNVYTCFGVARAFSKRFYKTIKFNSSIGEDAYSYMFCIYHKFIYHPAKTAVVQYKLPNNLGDHQRQSLRFLVSKKMYESYFGKEFVDEEYYLPFKIIFSALLITLYRYPLKTILYIIVTGYLHIKSRFINDIKNTWEISTSSKIFGA